MAHALTRLARLRAALAAATLALSGCSGLIASSDIVDADERREMAEAVTREDFEAVSGPPIETLPTTEGGSADLYAYVDGRGSWGRRDTREGLEDSTDGYALLTALSLGMLEPVMIPTAIAAIERATVQVEVVYDAQDRILAVCPLKYRGERDPRCVRKGVPILEASDSAPPSG